jgi:hypothetical protein
MLQELALASASRRVYSLMYAKRFDRAFAQFAAGEGGPKGGGLRPGKGRACPAGPRRGRCGRRFQAHAVCFPLAQRPLRLRPR